MGRCPGRGPRPGRLHFFTLCRPAREQARHFLAVAPPHADALPPAIDLELAGNCNRRPPRAEVDAGVREFLQVVEVAWGRPVLVYARDDWSSRYPSGEELGRPLWEFRFLRRPAHDGWALWQIHGFARVSGIRGGVDLNIGRSTPRAA